MRRLWRVLLLFVVSCGLSASLSAQGGFTTVTGTITGAIDGLVWSCGTISAQLITAGGAAPTLNGQSFSTSTSPIGLGCPTNGNPAGSFAMRLADNGVIVPSNTTWQFTVNMAPGIAPPAGTGPQSFTFTTAINCSTNTPSTCTSNAMSISAQLSAIAPKLSNAGTGTTFSAGTIDMTNPASFGGTVGAKFDGRSFSGANVTVSNGSVNFSVSGTLTQTDVGKGFIAIQWAGSDSSPGASCVSTTPGNATTIASVTSSTTGTLNQAAIANCGTTNGNVGFLVIATIDTSAIHAAKLAAFDGATCKAMVAPSGITIIDDAEWLTASCPGVGVGSTVSKYGSLTSWTGPGQATVFGIAPWFRVADCTGGGTVNVCFFSAPAVAVSNVAFNGFGNNSTTWNKILVDTANDSVYQNDIFELISGGGLSCFVNENGNHGLWNLIVDQCGSSNGTFTNNSNNGQAFELFSGNINTGSPVVNNGVFSCYSCAYFPLTGNGSMVTGGAGTTYYDYNGFNNTASDASGSACYFANGGGAFYLYGVNCVNTGNTASEAIAANNANSKVFAENSRLGGGSANKAWVCTSGATCQDRGGNTYNANPIGTIGCAVGTGTSPAACGGNDGGLIAVNTGLASFTVNTTTVTPNSIILIQQDTSTAAGTALGVTCNTTVSTALPLLTAKVAGTSFTFSLTAPVTNPDCFSYKVIN